MIKATCPIGCPGETPRPYSLRHELFRCRNCKAWLRVSARAEDGSLVVAEMVARPGEAPPADAVTAPGEAETTPTSSPARRGLEPHWLGVALVVCALGAALAALLMWVATGIEPGLLGRSASGDPYLGAVAFGPLLGLADLGAGYVLGRLRRAGGLLEPALAGLLTGAAAALLLGGAAALPVHVPVAALAAAVLAAAGSALGGTWRSRT
jgi:hypothetical protein